jgi:hypothetical protein
VTGEPTVAPVYTLDGEVIADMDDYYGANAQDFTQEDLDAIHALGVGERIIFGGGAAAEFVLERIR